jgi:excisionase family DNA binding protein
MKKMNVDNLIQPTLMKPKEVAAYLNVSKKTIKRLSITEKDFPKPLIVNRIVRYSKSKIDEWIEKKFK